MSNTRTAIGQRDINQERIGNGIRLPAIGGVLLAALLYPVVLGMFHRAVGSGMALPTGYAAISAAVWLAAAFACPTLSLLCAIRLATGSVATRAARRALRLAYFGAAAPTAYTLMGVVLYMLGNPVSDQWIWSAAWLLLAAWAAAAANDALPVRDETVSLPGGLRVAHGAAAAIIAAYVLFHIANHLLGLLGPEAHAAIMKLGRSVYRARLVEPLLVALFLFQVGSGLALAWRWSGRAASAFRAFQVASGVYLSIFILGHMNSVFIFARTYLKIDTGWAFATGAPAGLIHDPWNIRLVPHYWLGVFFALSHLASGLRVVLAAHGVAEATVARAWAAGLAASALTATAIIAGMCGLRL